MSLLFKKTHFGSGDFYFFTSLSFLLLSHLVVVIVTGSLRMASECREEVNRSRHRDDLLILRIRWTVIRRKTLDN